MTIGRKWVGLALLATLCSAALAEGASCVWKVTAPDGKTAYLGGSIHALSSTDYPLPPAYNRAFDASTHLAFEVDRKALIESSKSLVRNGQYPKGDNLKNHVDPRTYDYMRRLFALMKVPEAKFSQFKPWFIVIILQSPDRSGMSDDLGVDQYLMNRANARSKPVVGLESVREHAEVYSGLTDRQGETLLLMSLIPASGGSQQAGMMAAWRRGDADTIAQAMKEAFREYPAFCERLLDGRNRAWIPKIESFIRSGRTYFVVAGAAHYGGQNGVLAMLRGRGYKVEQL